MAADFQANLFPPSDDLPARARSAVTNDPAAARARRIDAKGRRSADGRRLNDLYVAIVQQLRLGDAPNAHQQAAALEAAELCLACENERLKLLRGEGDSNAVVRLSNLRTRALRRLGLDAPSSNNHSAGRVPSLAEYVSSLQPAPVRGDDEGSPA